MCGIIAIVRRRSTRPVPDGDQLLARLAEVTALLPRPGDSDLTWLVGPAAEILAAVDHDLRGEPGLRALLENRALASGVAGAVATIDDAIDDAERLLEDAGGSAGHEQVSGLEEVNAGLVRLKDAAWSLARDRLRAAAEVAQLGGADLTPAGVAAFFSIQQALSNLDRL